MTVPLREVAEPWRPVPFDARASPGDPYWFAVTPDDKTIYVSSATDDTVTVYDVAIKKQVKVIQLEQGLAPKRMQVVSAAKSMT